MKKENFCNNSEEKEQKKAYHIGLDIGNASVGWAVVEEDTNKVLKRGNKSLWGVRLFGQAETAENRRLFRSSRRRYDRRRKRIKLLQQEFMEEINKQDKNFFQKLKESAYQNDDAQNKTVKISSEERAHAKIYHKKYPTIYHLRQKVMEGKETDIRLVYLAIHHIIKYRGNFLYEQENLTMDKLDIKEKLKTILETFYQETTTVNFLQPIDGICYERLEKALQQSSKQDKKRLIHEELQSILPDKVLNEWEKMILGNTFSIQKLFALEVENEKETKISFKGSDYDEKRNEIQSILGNMIEVLEEMKALYDVLFLKELFKGEETTNISALMIQRYNSHKEDLQFLKRLLRPEAEDSKETKEKKQKEYKKMFKSKITKKKEIICIYEQYIRNHLNYADFKKELNKSLEVIFGLELKEELRSLYKEKYQMRIENELFLPRITNTDNGKYPYQLNKAELVQIIENQPYAFLKEKIPLNNGKEVYKLVRLLEFRIPYYVGPLNTTTDKKGVCNQNAWIETKMKVSEITPYNFDKVIDVDTTAERFITKMISHCTYLLNEEALPNHSLLYSEFKVRNELKQIKVNKHKLTEEQQEDIYKGLFLKTKKIIDDNALKKYLRTKPDFSMFTTLEIIGYSADKKFANTMKSYVDFFGEDGIFEGTLYTTKDAEEIIRWITIFEDKEILERKIKTNYSDLTENQLKKAVNCNYKGWGTLSRKLLTELTSKEKNGQPPRTIMELLRKTPDNFMQILCKKEYDFEKTIEKNNDFKKKDQIDSEVVANLATSPANKRGIYQALKIVEEITNYLGYPPKNIMIEMARGEEQKKRKDSRKEYLKKLYEGCKKSLENYTELSQELERQEEKDFQNLKLFLYFIQGGKSLYSQTTLDIEHLETYEIDHIIPRTLTKDDSIDNKALVLKEENQNKAASFVVPKEYQNKCNHWWDKLYENKLISAKKKYNLQRTVYSDEDIEGFIQRQLVETRQITKHVAEILKTYYEDSNVIYLKANVSHNYREKYHLFKFRELNDYHHAHDAYLAAVLGNYKEYYLQNVNFETLRENNKKLIQNQEYEKMNYGYLVNCMEIPSYHKKTGEVFDIEEFHQRIKHTLYRNDILISKKTEIQTGEFYQQTKNKKGKGGVPLKDNLPTEKYGGYTAIRPSYAAVVKYKEKGKSKQKMIGIPIFIDKKSEAKKDLKRQYIKDLLGPSAEDIEIIRDKIPFYSILNWEGQICSLVGAADKVEVCNALEFKIKKENLEKWKYTLNRLLNQKVKKEYLLTEERYTKELEEILAYILEKIETDYKLYQNLVEQLKTEIIPSELSTELKEKTIKELLNLLSFNSKTANLKDYGLSGWYGKKHSRIISHAKVICQSTTGIEKKIYEF